MSKIMELRTKRNALWEQTKAFLEKHRGENGLVEASAVEQYNKMAGEVQALGAEIAKPDTLLGRPVRTSSFMPAIGKGERVLLFGDLKNYWVADRQNRTFRRLNELYARTDQVGFMTTQRVDGRLILPESVKVLKMAGNKTAATTGGNG